MTRPVGSYRAQRRNEARKSKKPMIRFDEVQRINVMRQQVIKSQEQRK